MSGLKGGFARRRWSWQAPGATPVLVAHANLPTSALFLAA